MITVAFERLLRQYGPQAWWPAETPFEVMVGAVLVQQTTWANAARAVDRLKAAGPLDCAALLQLPEARLRALIRPAGFYRVKSTRLLHLARFLAATGGVTGLASRPTAALREALLGVHGIGPESADAILLYAFGRPVFVVDNYARRLFERLGSPEPRPSDRALKARSEGELRDASALNEFHALIVAHGKRHCGPVPACPGCCLRELCGHGRSSADRAARTAQL